MKPENTKQILIWCSGKDVWTIHVFEFNDAHIERLLSEYRRPDVRDTRYRQALREHMDAFTALCKDFASNPEQYDIIFIRSKFLNLRRDPLGSHEGLYPSTREDLKQVWQYQELEKAYEEQCDGMLLHERPGFVVLSPTEMSIESWDMENYLQKSNAQPKIMELEG